VGVAVIGKVPVELLDAVVWLCFVIGTPLSVPVEFWNGIASGKADTKKFQCLVELSTMEHFDIIFYLLEANFESSTKIKAKHREYLWGCSISTG